MPSLVIILVQRASTSSGAPLVCCTTLPERVRTTTDIILREESKGASPIRGREEARSLVVYPSFAASATRAASVGSPFATCSASSQVASEHSAMVRTCASRFSVS